MNDGLKQFTADAPNLQVADLHPPPGAPFTVSQVLPKHLSQIVSLERECFEFPWSFTDFLHTLTYKCGHGIVVTAGNAVVGYAFYVQEFYSRGTHDHRFVLTNLAVDAKWRRHGIAAALVDEVKRRLVLDRWPQIEAEVRERNLAAQLFFRSAGFRMVRILRSSYREVNEDGYLFRFTHRPEAGEQRGAAIAANHK